MIFQNNIKNCCETVLNMFPTKEILRGYNDILKISKITPVFISKYSNPYQNFAIEKMIFENFKVMEENKKQSIILIYKNEPSIVMGSFQNPWIECNLKNLNKEKINLCRRESGGGTVYHDFGNLNFTFYTSNTELKRTEIMESVAIFLKEYLNKNVKTNKRCDIMLDEEFKISGSAARIKSNKAYHHFTLLCHSNLSLLTSLLNSQLKNYTIDVKSKSTKSVTSLVANLFETFEEFQNVENDLIYKFGKYFANEKKTKLNLIYLEPYKYKFDNNNNFDSTLNTYTEYFNSKKWVFGNTPIFSFSIPIFNLNSEYNFYFKIKNGFILLIDLYKNNEKLCNIYNDIDLQNKYYFNMLFLNQIFEKKLKFLKLDDFNQDLFKIFCNITF